MKNKINSCFIGLILYSLKKKITAPWISWTCHCFKQGDIHIKLIAIALNSKFTMWCSSIMWLNQTIPNHVYPFVGMTVALKCSAWYWVQDRFKPRVTTSFFIWIKHRQQLCVVQLLQEGWRDRWYANTMQDPTALDGTSWAGFWEPEVKVVWAVKYVCGTSTWLCMWP